jgi:hypothetical protein
LWQSLRFLDVFLLACTNICWVFSKGLVVRDHFRNLKIVHNCSKLFQQLFKIVQNCFNNCFKLVKIVSAIVRNCSKLFQ